MFCNPRSLPRTGRLVRLNPEVLENRMLLSGNSFSLQSSGSAPREVVSVRVPSTYVSQSSSTIDVTITRTMGKKSLPIKSPLTLRLSANALAPATARGGKPRTSSVIAPLNTLVVFASGETSQTVALPIFVQAPLPSLVPVQITVSPSSHPQTEAKTMVDLASAQQLVPPSITAVSIVRQGSVGKGISVTFSQPMDPASVENVHNYSVKSVPLNKISLFATPNPSIVQPSSYLTTSSPQGIPLRAARYNPATDTVLLVPKSPLTVAKSYIVKSPTSLGSLRNGPKIAQPLTDANGNVLNPLNFPEGSFSITLSPKSS
jgi:hypothetical protein